MRMFGIRDMRQLGTDALLKGLWCLQAAFSSGFLTFFLPRLRVGLMWGDVSQFLAYFNLLTSFTGKIKLFWCLKDQHNGTT